jgi:hypothetical protein
VICTATPPFTGMGAMPSATASVIGFSVASLAIDSAWVRDEAAEYPNSGAPSSEVAARRKRQPAMRKISFARTRIQSSMSKE